VTKTRQLLKFARALRKRAAGPCILSLVIGVCVVILIQHLAMMGLLPEWMPIWVGAFCTIVAGLVVTLVAGMSVIVIALLLLKLAFYVVYKLMDMWAEAGKE